MEAEVKNLVRNLKMCMFVVFLILVVSLAASRKVVAMYCCKKLLLMQCIDAVYTKIKQWN